MPRFVNLPTTTGNEESVRVDRIESVSHGFIDEYNTDDTRSVVRTYGGDIINVALPKPKVMELLGLHLTNADKEWV